MINSHTACALIFAYDYACAGIGMGGGSGEFGWSLDTSLLHGTSGVCSTFSNDRLSADAAYEVLSVEVWGFTSSTTSTADTAAATAVGHRLSADAVDEYADLM
jgi:TLD